MDNTFVTANIHANTDTVIEVRQSGESRWIALGPVNIFADDATLARIHAATAPVVSECGREWHSVEIQGSSLLMSQLR